MHSAEIQDRDGAAKTLATIQTLHPWLRHIFADAGYAGDKLRAELAGIGRWTIEIIKRSDTANGFEVLSKRWVVERTFAWLGRCRRLENHRVQRNIMAPRGPYPDPHATPGKSLMGNGQF